MVWTTLVLIALIVLAVVAVVIGRRRARTFPADPDPLFIAGIVIAGTSAACQGPGFNALAMSATITCSLLNCGTGAS